METTLDLSVLEEAITHLDALSSTELTTFYCEACHERLNTELLQRPTNPFQEASGKCKQCGRFDDISNPYINAFLNPRGLTLEEGDGNKMTWAQLMKSDETTPTYDPVMLIKEWIIPYEYYRFLKHELSFKETEQTAWVKYGRQKVKKVYKSNLPPALKSLLTVFFEKRYALDRLDLPLVVVEELPDPQTPGAGSLDEIANLLVEIALVKPEENLEEILPAEAPNVTLAPSVSFIARLLTFWKGRKNYEPVS